MKVHLGAMTDEQALLIDGDLFQVSIYGELFNDENLLLTNDNEVLKQKLTLGAKYQFNVIITHGKYVMALTGDDIQLVIRAGDLSEIQ